MSLRTILVPQMGTKTDIIALSAAFGIAKTFNAHAEALFVRLDPRDAVPVLGEGMSGAMIEEIIQAAERDAAQQERAARTHFDAALATAGLPFASTPPGTGGATAAWRQITGRAEELVPEEGRLADLIVMPHTAMDADGRLVMVAEATLLGAGRPLLLVPAEAPAAIGRRVAVAWNGSTESARAVAGALPFLKGAEGVHVLMAETPSTEAATGRRIAEYFAWQSVNVLVTIVKPGSEPVGQTLMKQAASLGCDLLVMGGYGHSRMREMILGGVTRYVLNHAGMPVLMAH